MGAFTCAGAPLLLIFRHESMRAGDILHVSLDILNGGTWDGWVGEGMRRGADCGVQ